MARFTPFHQVALKNNIDVFYFQTLVPPSVYFGEDGMMDKSTFVSTWQDISQDNEKQFPIQVGNLDAGEFRDV